MKFAKIFVSVVAAVVFSAGFVFAADDVNVSVRNDNANSATATGGNANQNQNQDQAQKQKQKQIQTQTTSGVEGSQSQTVEMPRNFITAPLIQGFVQPVTPSTPMGWKQLGCDFIVAEFTIAELREMSKGASFMKKRGTFWYSILTDDVEYSIIRGINSNLSDSTVVKIMTKIPTRVRSETYFGEAEGIGRYGAPMGQILGATVLGLVLKTGVTQVVISWDYLVESTAMANTLGLGVSGAITGERNASSISLGVAGSTAYSLTSIAYRIKAQAFNGMRGEFFSCEAPVSLFVKFTPAPAPEPPKVVEPPKPPACNPEPIRMEIERLKVEISKCKVWSLNNEILRFLLANAYANLAKCTGENGYYSDAIENYKLAEKNYLNGKDIKANQAEADRILYKVYWNWAAAIREVAGRDAEVRFAQDKKLTTMPSGIDELKR